MIVERNIFGLKPLPPPPTEEVLPPPPAPPSKVVLTGITSIFGAASKRALLEITEQAQQGKQPETRRPILREGERDGSVEVLSIDIEKSIVRIRNGTVETDLTFETSKSASAPNPQPMVPAPPVTTAIPGFNPAAGAGAGMSPTIISRDTGGDSGGGGITIVGGTPTSAVGAAAAGPTIRSLPMAAGIQAASGGIVAGGAGMRISAPGIQIGGAEGGLRLPTRQVRTQPADDQRGTIDAAVQWIHMKAQEEEAKRKQVDFPPIPSIPGLDDGPEAPPAPPAPVQTAPPVPSLPGRPLPLPR